MTTQTFTSVLDHSTDAAFRAWGAEIGVNLALVGMVQTADTGQINWTTVTRPGTNTAAGYEIWRFADSSLYLKIEYGTAAAGAAIPQGWITVGTGSNGSGTITGQTSTRATWFSGAAPTSAVATYTSYFCHVADALGLLFKQNSWNTSASPTGFLVIGKSVDSSGAATSTGFGVLRQGVSGGNGVRFQAVRTASAAVTFTESSQYAQVVGDVTSSLVGSDIQAYYVWLNLPQTQPFIWANVYVVAEITENNTFSVAMVSTATKTYLAIGAPGNLPNFAGQSASVYGFGMIYQ